MHTIQTIKVNPSTVTEALELAEKLARTARRYFPKSIRNSDTFQLELTSSTVSKAQLVLPPLLDKNEELVRQNGELREALRELLKEAQANFEVANKYLEDLQPSKAFVAAQALLSSLKTQGSPKDVLGHAVTETTPLG